MQGILKSPPKTVKIRDLSDISTKRNQEVAGRTGKYIQKLDNHRHAVEVDGKIYNFFRSELFLPDKVVSAKIVSPNSLSAEKIASDFLASLDTSIADKVIKAICKRRTSRKKSPNSSPTRRRSPNGSPTRRRSTKRCPDDQEISIKNGRCINKCRDDQIRDKETNRCRKLTTLEKVGMKVNKPIIRKKSPTHIVPNYDSDSDDDIILEDNDDILEDNSELREQRVMPPTQRKKVPTPELVDDSNYDDFL